MVLRLVFSNLAALARFEVGLVFMAVLFSIQP